MHRVVEQIKDPHVGTGEHVPRGGVVLDNRQKSGLEDVIAAYLNSEFLAECGSMTGDFPEHDFIIPTGFL